MRTETVFVKQLELAASIGVFDWEKKVRQNLVFDLDLEIDFSLAAETDTLGYTVNYADVCDEIRLIVEAKHYDLLEALALDIETMLLDKFAVLGFCLQISKPGAVKEAQAVGIRITRSSNTRNTPTSQV